MHWKVIDKTKTTQPKKGKYSDWKGQLAEEGFGQCVYCSTKDSRLGGVRNFHVEHFRPKSKFPKLKNDINNLFYACPICNVFKSDDWYKISNSLKDVHYPNPSKYNYGYLFSVYQDGLIKSKNPCGKYIINKLALNRRQLVVDRRFTILLKGYDHIKTEYNEILHGLINNKTEEAMSILKKLFNAYDSVITKKDTIFESSPYQINDTKR